MKRSNRDLALKQRRALAKLRAEVLALMGGCCVRCGYEGTALQIDHVNGGGHQERLREAHTTTLRKIRNRLKADGKYPDYQLLCANCNWEKRYAEREFGGLKYT